MEMMPKTDLSLEIIGSGEYEKELRKIANNLRISEKISFLGSKSHEEVMAHLKNFSGFGIAPYSIKSDWVVYCDPVKVKEYLSCLIPVIISDVPEIAKMIEEKKAGFVYENKDSLLDILKKISVLTDFEYEEMLKNIMKIRNDFDLKLIYEKI
jgi:glycosyltransferase involved in cell wall biosynthesis